MSFLGKQYLQLDEKNRMRIPAKFRQELGEHYYLMQGISGCLFLMTQNDFNLFIAPFSAVPISDIAGQKKIRRILEMVLQPEEDAQGRFVLPQEHKKSANIDKKVLFIGVGSRVEIWSEEEYEKSKLDEDDGTLDSAFQGLSGYGV